jgi:hypothetical protein
MKQDKMNQQITPEEEDKMITRKEALKKAGKYAAVTAASMFIILSPKESQANSSAPNPGW